MECGEFSHWIIAEAVAIAVQSLYGNIHTHLDGISNTITAKRSVIECVIKMH